MDVCTLHEVFKLLRRKPHKNWSIKEKMVSRRAARPLGKVGQKLWIILEID